MRVCDGKREAVVVMAPTTFTSGTSIYFDWLDTHPRTHLDDLHNGQLKLEREEHPLAALSFLFSYTHASNILSLSLLLTNIWHAWQCASCIALLKLFFSGGFFFGV